VSTYYAIVGSAFTVSAAGYDELAERIFGVIAHTDSFDGNKSIAALRVSGASLEESSLRKALVTVYGARSPQLVKFDYKMGVRYLGLKNLNAAEVLLTKSYQMDSTTPCRLKPLRQLIRSKLSLVEAQLDNKERAAALIHDAIAEFSLCSSGTKREVLNNLFEAAEKLNDSDLLNSLSGEEVSLTEQPEQPIGHEWVAVDTISYAGIFLILIYAVHAASEFFLLTFFLKKLCTVAEATHGIMQQSVYCKLIELELYQGKIEQANAHSIRLLHASMP
jgi:hypothetical protein